VITLDDLKNALPQDVLLYLVDEEGAGTLSPDGEARAQAALREAWGEVESYLAQRYALPLPTLPEVLRAKAVDIAVYRLMMRRGIRPGSPDEAVVERYRAAVSFLRDVATGKASLPLPPTSQPAQPKGGAKIRGERTFSRKSLEDF
jgi:phage gp36-like protein